MPAAEAPDSASPRASWYRSTSRPETAGPASSTTKATSCEALATIGAIWPPSECPTTPTLDTSGRAASHSATACASMAKSAVVAERKSPVERATPRSSVRSTAMPRRASASARTAKGRWPSSASSRSCGPEPLDEHDGRERARPLGQRERTGERHAFDRGDGDILLMVWERRARRVGPLGRAARLAGGEAPQDERQSRAALAPRARDRVAGERALVAPADRRDVERQPVACEGRRADRDARGALKRDVERRRERAVRVGDVEDEREAGPGKLTRPVAGRRRLCGGGRGEQENGGDEARHPGEGLVRKRDGGRQHTAATRCRAPALTTRERGGLVSPHARPAPRPDAPPGARRARAGAAHAARALPGLRPRPRPRRHPRAPGLCPDGPDARPPRRHLSAHAGRPPRPRRPRRRPGRPRRARRPGPTDRPRPTVRSPTPASPWPCRCARATSRAASCCSATAPRAARRTRAPSTSPPPSPRSPSARSKQQIASPTGSRKRVATEAAREEMRLAREIQRGLLPRTLPAVPGLDVAVRWRPSAAVSGDTYDAGALADGRLVVAVADVVGKGLPAALLTSTVQAGLRLLRPDGPDPGRALAAVTARLDRLIAESTEPHQFATLAWAVVMPGVGPRVVGRGRASRAARRPRGRPRRGARRRRAAPRRRPGCGVRVRPGDARAGRRARPVLGRPDGVARRGGRGMGRERPRRCARARPRRLGRRPPRPPHRGVGRLRRARCCRRARRPDGDRRSPHGRSGRFGHTA